MSRTASILIIDDEISQRKTLSLILKKKGYHIESAGTGKEALEKATHCRPDLILLDMKLPDTDGLEIITPLKAINPDMAIIVVTGFASIESSVHSLNAGVSGYLVKPVNADEMLTKISDHLERQELIRQKREADLALAESEKKFREIFNSANDGIHLCEYNEESLFGKFIDANDVACRMVGYSLEELKEMDPFDLIIDLKTLKINKIGEKIRNNGSALFETIQKRKDGLMVPVEVNAHVIEIQGKKMILSVIRDLTQRKKDEAAFRRLNTDLKAIIDHAPSMIWYKDTKNNFIRVNPAAARSIGMPIEMIEGKNCYDLFPDFPEEYYLDELEVIRSGKPKLGIIEQITAISGEKLWVQTDKIPLIDDNRNVIGVLLFITDITELKKAQQQIEEYSTFLSTLLDTLPIPLFYNDAEGKYLGCNPPFEDFIGIKRSELVGKNVYDIAPKDLADIYWAVNRQFLNNNALQKYDSVVQYVDGTLHDVIFYKAPFFNHNGTLRGVIGTFLDVTEIKRANDALQMANRKLNLLSSITRHDIMNQIQALNFYIELCKEDLNRPDTIKNYIDKEEIISEAITHQINFTKDYEDIGVRSAAWQNIEEIIEKSRASLPLRNIRMELSCPGLEVFADPLLEKVFYNLIDNSLRYGGDKLTVIRIIAQRENEKNCIVYEDDGIGISNEDKKHLFSKGFGHHTGLGLFLSREILSITGITINETGEPGKGARFEITVPKKGCRFI